MRWLDGLSSFSYCLEMLLATGIYMIRLEKREKYPLRILGGILLLFFCALFIHPYFDHPDLVRNWGWFFIVFLMLILISRFVCNISWTDAIYGTSCGYATQHFASSIYILLIYQGTTPEWSGWLYILLFLVIYAVAYFLFARNLSENGHFDAGKESAILMMILVLSVALALSMSTKQFAEKANIDVASGAYMGLFRNCQIYAGLTCLFLLWLQSMQKKELRAVRRLEQNELIWKERQKQYQISRDNIDLINRKCHDLRHQIAALSRQEGNDPRREEFVKEVQEMVEVYDTGANTGNEALDTILMEKGLYCHMHQINWYCVADGELLKFMDVVDLYTLLGNALDNAVESVEKLEAEAEKQISVRIWRKNSFGVLQVENTCGQAPESDADGLPKTSKQDRQNHGFGVRSMRSIVKKYHGTLSVKAEDGMFLLYAVFPLEK